MGSCQAKEEDSIVEPSKLKAPGFSKVFKELPRYNFTVPPALFAQPETWTTNGTITDFVAKVGNKIQFLYDDTKLEGYNAGNKFVDKKFPAASKSVGKEDMPEVIEWKRPTDFMEENFKIFQGTIDPSDIKQGKLGDCYLLSSLACISQYPFIVKRIFEETQPDPAGIYGVWLFIDGLWINVVVDDFFPLHANRPVFSRGINQLWIMILEKAYAKVFGSYAAIESGLTGIALNALTGAPYEYLCKNSEQAIDVEAAWTFLISNYDRKYLLTASTENNDRNQYMGLVSSHAYTILDVKEIYVATKKGKRKERIVKMENPWGRYEWKGRWSDFSDVWTQELRQELQTAKTQDGIFWIAVQDLIANFSQLCCCMYNKNYLTTSLPLKFSEEKTVEHKGVFIAVNSRSEGYLTLTQKDHRFFDREYRYSPVRLIVMRMDKASNNLNKYVTNLLDCDRDGTVPLNLDPGLYYVLIEVDWIGKYAREMVLNYYGQQPVSMAEDLKPAPLQEIFHEIVVLHEPFTEKERIYQYAKDPKIRRITGSIAGYVYYHYVNSSTTNNYLCETVEMRQRKFIDVEGEDRPDQFTVKVFPDEQRIVRLRVAREGNSVYAFSTRMQFFVVEHYPLEKLRELTDKKPTKVKKRQIEGKEIEVRVKTYSYSGGIVLLYQNKMDKYVYIEEIFFELDNLTLQNHKLQRNNKFQIELEPESEIMLSFVVDSPGKEIVFKTKMSFYLNSPEFKF